MNRPDEKLMTAPTNMQPWVFVYRMGCIASVLLVAISELVLLALMVADEVAWLWWLYVVVPIGAWILFIAGPVMFKSRRAVMVFLDALIRTFEAWLAKAGYVIDLNRDGQIGHKQVKVQPPQIQEVRPILLNAPRNATIMPLDVEAVGQGDDGDEPEDDIPQRRVWHCPDGLRVDQETLEDFVDGVFSRGLTRGRWVPGSMERETYDGLVALLEQARLIEDRKPGHSGKLTVRTSRQARAVLGLPVAG